MDRDSKGRFIKGNKWEWSSTHQPKNLGKSFAKNEYNNEDIKKDPCFC